MQASASSGLVHSHGYRCRSLMGSSILPRQLLVFVVFALSTPLSHASFFSSAASSATCYWPDGSKNDEYEPCSSSTRGPGASLCCRGGDICLEDGVCQAIQKVGDGITLYYRPACTSKDWSKDDNCPTDCVGNGVLQGVDAPLTPCPNDSHKWICHDDNLSKANCTSGDYIITLADKPVPITTLPSSSSSSSHSTTSSPTVTVITLSGNSTSVAVTTSSGGGAGGISVSATPTPPPAGSQSGLPGPTASPLPPADQHRTAVVSLAAGISVGGAALILAGIFGFLYWRRRQRDKPARAESPPPRNTLDDLDPALPGLVFRADSLRNRQSNNNMSGNANSSPTGGGSGGSLNGIVPMASAVTASSSSGHHYNNRVNSMRNNSMRNNSLHSNRFTPDAVAMHDVPRSPSANWLQSQGQGPSNGTNKPPEIPYDGRRFAPYYGVPPGEVNGYSELPG